MLRLIGTAHNFAIPPRSPMTTSRFPSPPPLLSIQILRAVAALMIAVVHTRYEFEFKFGIGDVIPPMTALAAGVDLFFVISGFVMAYGSFHAFGQPGASQDFITRRLIRIVPLYWIATSVLVAHVLLHYPSLAAAKHSVGTIIASYLFVPWPGPTAAMTPILAQGWTLNYEMFFYLLFTVSLLARPRIGLIGLALTLILFVLIGRTSRCRPRSNSLPLRSYTNSCSAWGSQRPIIGVHACPRPCPIACSQSASPPSPLRHFGPWTRHCASSSGEGQRRWLWRARPSVKRRFTPARLAVGSASSLDSSGIRLIRSIFFTASFTRCRACCLAASSSRHGTPGSTLCFSFRYR
jgi:hypothetical protein